MEKEFYDSLEDMPPEEQASSLTFFVRLFNEPLFQMLQECVEKEKSRRLKRYANGINKSGNLSVASSVEMTDNGNHTLSPNSSQSASKRLKSDQKTKKSDVYVEPKDLLNEFLDAGVEHPKEPANATSHESSQTSQVEEDDEYQMRSEDDLLYSFNFSPEKMSQSSQTKAAAALFEDEVKENLSVEDLPKDAVGQFFTCSGKKIVSNSTVTDIFKNIDEVDP